MLSSRPRVRLCQCNVDGAFRQFLAEAALVELGDQRPLELVALVDERGAEGEADVAEDLGILGPRDHRARAHHRRQVAVDEGRARKVGDAHHVGDLLALGLALLEALGLRQHDLHFDVVRQIVERRHDRPAVHLALIDLLRAVIEAGGVAEADRVRRGEQPEVGMRPDHLRLVEQGELAGHFEHALDHEHDVGAARVVLVEAQRRVGLQRPGQDAFAEFGDLLALFQDDGVLADEVDAADVAVEVDAHARPVEPRGHLLHVGRFAGAVVALDHHAPVVFEAGQDRERDLLREHVVRVEVRHVVVGLGVGRHHEVGIDAEYVSHGHGLVRRAGRAGLGLGRHSVLFPGSLHGATGSYAPTGGRCVRFIGNRFGQTNPACFR